MKISCPSCEAKYSIADEKVQARRAKIHCRKCGANIVIDGRVSPPSITIGDGAGAADVHAAPSGASNRQYTVDFGENDQRTMSIEEVIASYNSGYATAETYLWADGMTDWTPLGQVEEIVQALNAAATGTSPAATSSPQASQAPAVASSGRAAARPAGPDLFGKIALAGSEEDVTTSVPHEPAVPTMTTGARQESSVLFSLSALTASAKGAPSVPAPAMSSAAAQRDDSGLIDLKALAAQASQPSPSGGGGPADAPSPFGGLGGGMGAGLGGGLGAPLGGGLRAPLGGVGGGGMGAPIATPDIAYPQQRNRTGLYVGGGIVVAGIALAIAFAARPAPPPPAPPPIPTPVVRDEPKEEPTTVATPPPTGTGSASAAPTAGKPPRTWRRRSSRSSGSGSADAPSTQGGGDTPAAKPRPTSKCGCSPSDLPCNMRCAARGG